MKTLSTQIADLKKKNRNAQAGYKPVFLKLNKPAHLKKFKAFLKQPGLTLCDTIHDQLRELIKTENPQKKYTASEMQTAISERLGKVSLHDYGVWVYYPWANRIVHLLDKKEFIKVRTSRNLYKITPAEAETLAGKKMGVIGLSVGQSVSLTLAMERICGELRLADFDVLELTNLNRIRTGLHNLSLPKVYSVAREISEIDPYIKVVCFPGGLTEKNMTSFFMRGGKLDLVVEESDGFDIKILSRYKARELRIPVIMEASDRCMVDVERFDLEPKRSILHGLVDHLDVDTLRKLKTTEEKIPYMLDVLGIETSSLRLKASMLEIEQTVNTWPQLASSVTMGGGITADVCRRMLLGYFNESGRYYVDVEELIGPSKTEVQNPIKSVTHADFDFRAAAEKIQIRQQDGQLFPAVERVEEIVASACKAPSGGNSQPWRWVYKQGCLLLFNPFEPGLTILDYKGLASLIAIGAAVENLHVHTSALGMRLQAEYFPEGHGGRLVAIFRFYKSITGAVINKARFSAINIRLTNRTIAARERIDEIVLQKLMSAATEIEGANLKFITDPKQLDVAGDLLGELEKIRLLEKKGHLDFVNEMRWTKEENEEKRDGVDIRTVDLTNSELAGFNIAKNADVIDLLSQWKGGGAFKKLTKKSIDGAGAVGILSINGNSDEHYIQAGRALERVWLEANLNGVAFQPVSACLFLYARLIRGNGSGLSGATCDQLKKLRPMFEHTFLITKNSQEMFIFRLTNCTEPEVRSLRKPLKDLFCYF